MGTKMSVCACCRNRYRKAIATRRGYCSKCSYCAGGWWNPSKRDRIINWIVRRLFALRIVERL
jgi:hypothetical protein